MSDSITRRAFATMLGGAALAGFAPGQEPAGPHEQPFTRDYPEPGFKPSWKKAQLNRMMLADFIIYAHSDLEMVKKFLDREPMLINGLMDWGGGDWESALGGASHMGRHDIVAHLLERGARIDIFTMTMMGQYDGVKALLALQPKLIDARGPHGFSLHFHAQLAGKEADRMVALMQSIKKIELKPNPFVKK